MVNEEGADEDAEKEVEKLLGLKKSYIDYLIRGKMGIASKEGTVLQAFQKKT